MSRKEIISFAATPELKKLLRKNKNYTIMIQAILERSMGLCPTCHQCWPKNSEEKQGEITDGKK